jgi:bile acid:Na+ symporter, BASS family
MLDRVLARFKTILERFLLVWLVLLCSVAYWWTTWFPGTGTFDPFVASAGGLSILIFVTMLAIGSLLPEDEIRQVFRRWPTVLGGTAIQYTVMPLLAYSVGRILGLEGDWLVGIVMVGCVPGAMASNVLTLVARGNVSYSVSLTASATILSPIVVPFVMWLTLGQVVENFPAGQTCWKLCWMVVLPVVVGHVLSRNWPKWRAVAQRLGAIAANLTILWIIAVVVAAKRDQLPQLPGLLVVGLIVINLGGYLAGFFGGSAMRVSSSMRRALTLEIGMQNAGLGATLSTQLFPDTVAALPAAMYTFGCMFTGTILARLWAGRSG